MLFVFIEEESEVVTSSGEEVDEEPKYLSRLNNLTSQALAGLKSKTVDQVSKLRAQQQLQKLAEQKKLKEEKANMNATVDEVLMRLNVGNAEPEEKEEKEEEEVKEKGKSPFSFIRKSTGKRVSAKKNPEEVEGENSHAPATLLNFFQRKKQTNKSIDEKIVEDKDEKTSSSEYDGGQEVGDDVDDDSRSNLGARKWIKNENESSMEVDDLIEEDDE